MTGPSLFRELFVEAPAVPARKFGDWFNAKTATFGGQDALETVRELVGNASKFDFGTGRRADAARGLARFKAFFELELHLQRAVPTRTRNRLTLSYARRMEN